MTTEGPLDKDEQLPVEGEGDGGSEGEGWGRTGFWLALGVMLAICLFAVWRSALFRLERVQISGSERFSQADIMAVTGLQPGMLKWEVSAARVQARIEAEPWVRSARVSWRGNLAVIAITERVPVGLLQYQGRYYLILDEEGVILGERLLDEGEPLPVIAGLTVTQALRGQRLTHRGLQDGLSLLAWTAEPLRRQVSELQIKEDRQITLFMTGGTTVNWGVLPDPGADRDAFVQQQIRLFADFLDRVPRARLARCQVDLRVPGDVRGLGCE